MIKKLSRHGNSLALIIDKPILELLRITENTPLKITTNGSTIIVEPVDPADRTSSGGESHAKADLTNLDF